MRDIRSGANAYGLMQLVPATARQYAQRLKLRYSLSLLTNADANIRMGTAYLADKIRQFGDVHLALASYNAGERAVRRWVAERPDLADREEFIDDIPYPETGIHRRHSVSGNPELREEGSRDSRGLPASLR